MEATEPSNEYDWLLAKARIEERPFTSKTAVVGRAIVWFRELWNSISTKWYVRPLLQQQNEYNRLVVNLVREHDVWLIAQDREQTDLIHNTAELTSHLIQMNHLLQSIDERLARLEADR
jgi:hypothetical protein